MSISTVYQRMKDEGYSPAGIAAVIGNVLQESGGNPNAVGDGGNSFGLFQHHKDRKNQLIQYAQASGRHPSDPEAQVDFALHEIKRDYPKLDAVLRKDGDPGLLAKVFGRIFERPNEQSANWEGRAANAQKAYQVVNNQTATVDGATPAEQPKQVRATLPIDEKARKILLPLYENSKTNKPEKLFVNDLMGELMSQLDQNPNLLLPGYNRAQTDKIKQAYAANPPKADISEDQQGQYRLWHTVVKNALKYYGEPTAGDVAANLPRAVTGISPNMAGELVGTASRLVQPKDEAQKTGAAVADRLDLARKRIGDLGDMAMQATGSLATLPIALGSRASLTAAAVPNFIQGVLSSEEANPKAVAINGLLGAGLGVATDLTMRTGMGLGGLVKRQFTDSMEPGATKLTSEAFNVMGGGDGTAVLNRVAQGLKNNPELPVAVQSAANAQYNLHGNRDPYGAVITRVIRSLVTHGDPITNQVVNDGIGAILRGGDVRTAKLFEDLFGANKNGDEIVAKMFETNKAAAEGVKDTLINAVPKLADKPTIDALLKQSPAYRSAVAAVRDERTLRGVPNGAPIDSTAFQMAVRSKLSEWQHDPKHKYYQKLSNEQPDGTQVGKPGELDITRDLLTKGTEVNGTSLWNAYNELYAEPNTLKRALDEGKSFAEKSPAEIAARMPSFNRYNGAEQEAFLLGVMGTFRDKLKSNNYKVQGATGLTDELTNKRLRAAFNDPQKVDRFLKWVGEQSEVSNVVQGIGANRAGSIAAEGMGLLQRLVADPVFTAGIARGSHMFAVARGVGEALQFLAGNKAATPEARRLAAAWMMTDNPAVQQRMIDSVMAQYQRDYWKSTLRRVGATTGTNFAIRSGETQ